MDLFFAEFWEIWHSYSTYFKAHVDNLEKVAELLVTLKIADCSVMSDGKTFLQTDKDLLIGKTVIELSGNRQEASIKFEANDVTEAELTPYANETWLICSNFLCGEARFLQEEAVSSQSSTGKELPAAHLRSFLRPIYLVRDGERITIIYPVITFYQTGVLIVSFRMMSPDKPIEIRKFITNYVNIHEFSYDYAMVPIAISALAPEACQIYQNSNDNLLKRLIFLKNKEINRKALSILAQKVDLDDFDFEMTPLSSAGSKEDITSIVQTIFTIIGFLVKKPTSKFEFLLKGVSNLPKLGSYWSGRPHVYIIKHNNQQDTASLNEELHKESFGRILARIPEAEGDFSVFIPQSNRTLDDFSAYITLSMTLWVWSNKGLENKQDLVANNIGGLIYERQVQIELLEYGFMLHKSLAEKSCELKNYSDLLSTRRALSELKSKMLEVTPYGEVRELLNPGWEKMNLAAVQNQISENLSILDSEIKFIESKQGDSLRFFMAMFSLIASASFAKSVVSPAWIVLDLWLPMDENWAELFLVLMSSVFVIIIFSLIRSISR